MDDLTADERALLGFFLDPPTKYVMVPERNQALARAARTLVTKGWIRELEERSFPGQYPVYYLGMISAATGDHAIVISPSPRDR